MERRPEIEPRALGDHGHAFGGLLRRGGHGEVIVDHGRDLARQRIGAKIGFVVEQPRRDLAERAVAGKRQIFLFEIGADKLLGAFGREACQAAG